MAKEKEKEKVKASYVLGVIAVATAIFLSWISVIVAIVGLCLPKTKGKETRDITLNVIAIILGLISWAFWLMVIGYF